MHASFQCSRHCLQVYIRIDQPQTALEQYSQAASRQEGQIDLLLGQARVHDALNDLEQGVKLYKQVILLYSLNTLNKHVHGNDTAHSGIACCSTCLHANCNISSCHLMQGMQEVRCELCKYLSMMLAMWKR